MGAAELPSVEVSGISMISSSKSICFHGTDCKYQTGPNGEVQALSIGKDGQCDSPEDTKEKRHASRTFNFSLQDFLKPSLMKLLPGHFNPSQARSKKFPGQSRASRVSLPCSSLPFLNYFILHKKLTS